MNPFCGRRSADVSHPLLPSPAPAPAWRDLPCKIWTHIEVGQGFSTGFTDFRFPAPATTFASVPGWCIQLLCVSLIYCRCPLPLPRQTQQAKQWNRASAATATAATTGANCCCRSLSLCMVSRSIGYRGTFGFQRRRQSVGSRCSDSDSV